MKMLFSIPVAILYVVLATPGTVDAASFLLNFSAGPFNPGSAPDNPVTGSFTYSAASATSPITSVDSVNLTIDGKVYSLAEVGSTSSGSNSTIGALSGGGAGSISGGGLDDFRLTWDHTTGVAGDFRYSTASTSALFTLSNPGGAVSPFSITTVPEPGTGALALVLGAGVLAGRRLRRRREPAVDEPETAAL